MNRILLLGSPGAGKSYFSKKLAQKIKIPLYHLDNIF
jgi:adenylate kinase family enzyme